MVFNSLKSRIIASTIGIVIVSLAVTIGFLYFRVTAELSQAFDDNARNLLEATISHVDTQHRGIVYHQSVMLSRRKTELKNNTAIAFANVYGAYNHLIDGQISETLAKQRVITALQNLRYDNGIGYFWINDTTRPHPRMIMHPTIPELNGTILDDPKFNSALGRKENLFKAFVDVCLAQEEGYVDYYWPKPVEGGLTENQPKLSYVRLFKPWNWVIGTGLYIDDIEQYVQASIDNVIRDLNLTLNKQQIGEHGYLAIFNEHNRMLVHPTLAGQFVSDLTNPSTGKPLIEEMKMAALSSKSVLDYVWDKPGFEGEYRFRKRAFLDYYEPLGWYIFSAVYLDDYEQKTSELTRTLVLFSSGFILLALVITMAVLRSMTMPLNRLTRTISRTDDDGIPLQTVKPGGTTEINALGQTINRMVFSIKASRKELQTQRDFSQGIIDGAPVIIAGLTPEGIATYINPAGETVTGYKREEIIGKNWWEHFFPDRAEELSNVVFSHMGQDTTLDYEMTLTRRDGEQKQIVWTTYAKRDKYNDALEIYWIGNDVTERKQAEENLRQLRNYLASIINSMPSLLIGIDVNGRVTQWNTAAQLNTGISPASALGKTLQEVYPRLGDEMDRIRSAMHSRQVLDDIRHVHNDNGTIIHEEITVYPLVAGDDEGAVIRVDNISDKVQMEEMMIQSEKMLSVGGLAAGMAHEINNPLAAMMQTASVISSRLVKDLDLPVNRKAAAEAGTEPEAIKRYMESRGIPRMIANIMASGQRVAAIVNNMLSFARKSDEQISTKNMIDLVDKTLELAVTDYDLKKHYDFRLIKVFREYDDNLPPIPCEGPKIQQVLLNILRNGAEAMQEAGVETPTFIIRAQLETENEMLRLEIEDNGPGIDAQHCNHIFEPFYTTKPVGVGTGLGLSVSYFIIVENHGGELTVESQPGYGARFIIRLPLDRKKPARAS